MADAADRADILVERATELALSKISVPVPGTGRPNCIHCDDQIPEPRTRLGYRSCIDCQELIERGVLRP